MKIIKSISLTIVCLVLGVLLALQYKSIDSNQKLLSEEYDRIEDVKSQLLSEIRKNEELGVINEKLNEQIETFQTASGDENDKIRLIEEELIELRLFSGLVDVTGSGVVVTIDRGEHEYSSIRDTDLLKLINELRASGAQAISVNNERLLAMSEIREAGNYMIINGKQISEPYIVRAISDKDKLESSITMVGGIMEELLLYMDVKIEKKDDIIINKIEDEELLIDIDLLEALKES